MAAMSAHTSSVENKIAGAQEEAEMEMEMEMETEAAAVGPDVTRHIMVKSSRSTQVSLEKAVVLRRIRHRKRVNKFQAVVGALFSSPFADKTDETRQRKWVDEPFTSL